MSTSSTAQCRYLFVACQVLTRDYPTSSLRRTLAVSEVWEAMTPEQKLTWETNDIGYLPPHLAVRAETDFIVKPRTIAGYQALMTPEDDPQQL
jgi:hypothetical protein